jgi:hypothetical protein
MPPPPPVPDTSPGPDGKPPLKVAVVGDSLADGLAYGLQVWAHNRGDVVIYDLATRGCPLSRSGTRRFPNGDLWPVADGCGWWNDAASDRSLALRDFNPDIVVAQDGMNEVPDRKLPSWTTWRSPGQPNFDSWLVNENAAAIKTFSANGANVLFLNAACADWLLLDGPWADYDASSEGDTRVAALNRDYQALSVTGAKSGDLGSHLCPNGKFTQTVDGVSSARPDGYHLSPAAATAVANQWLGPLVLSAKPATKPTI